MITRAIINRTAKTSLATFTRSSTAINPETLASVGADIPRYPHLPINGTFARATTATNPESLTSVASGTPRYVAGKYGQGILIEEGTTNLVHYSHEFDNAWWSKTNATISANAIAAPDGSLTADKLVETTAETTTHDVRKASVFTLAEPGSISVYAKKAERTWLRLAFIDVETSSAYFDLDAGVAGYVGTNVSASITEGAGGWYKCAIYTASAPSTSAQIYIADGSGGRYYTGDGTSGIYIWGAQAEAKAYPTSYVPTSGGTTTRNAEDLILPSLGTISPAKGTVEVWVYVTDAIKRENARIFQIEKEPSDIGLICYVSGGGSNFTAYFKDDAGTNQGVVADMPSNGWHHVAVTWDKEATDKLSIYVDGLLKSSRSTLTFPTSFKNTLYIGHRPPFYLNSYLDDLRISNIARSASQIAAAAASASPAVADQYTTALLNFDATTQGTSGRQGILVEESTTNLVNYSHEFDNVWWAKTESSVTSNVSVAPDDTTTMDKLVESTGNAFHYLNRNPVTGLTVGQAATYTVYAKKGERDRFWMGSNAAYGMFDLTNGVVLGTAGTGVTPSIESVGGGIYRCITSVASLPDVQFQLGIRNESLNTYLGDGTSGLYIWGAQAEAKAYPTSYVLTSGGTATRNAEVLKIPTPGVLNLSAGTVEGWLYADTMFKNGRRGIFAVARSNNASGDAFWFERRTDNTLIYGWVDDSNVSTTVSAADSSLAIGATNHFALTWDSLGHRFFINGTQVGSTATVRRPSGLQPYAAVGVNSSFNGTWADTYLKSIRISNVSRSAGEIAVSAASAKPLGMDSHTTALLAADGSLTLQGFTS